MMGDKDVKRSSCYLCNKASKKIVSPFSPSGKFFLAVSLCETHGYVKTKIRVKKTDDDKYFCVKTRKIIKEAEAEEIKKRYDKLKDLKKPVKVGKAPKASKKTKKADNLQ